MVTVLEQFLAGAMGSCIASTVTNPIEVVKTRLQLQGELASAGKAPKVYTGLGQALKLIWRNEGIKGIQSGLGAAYCYQIVLSGIRLGCYEPIRQEINNLFGVNPQQHHIPLSVLTGVLTGGIASYPASPFYLVKVRMQSYSPHLGVGDQTRYTSIWDGLKSLAKERRLFQGSNAAALKLCVISAVHMPVYNLCKQELAPWMSGSVLWLNASIVSSAIGAVVMNPFDVVMTRMYNQATPHYRNLGSCFVQTVRIEGFMGLYKGFLAAGLRSGLQNVLSLMAMDAILDII